VAKGYLMECIRIPIQFTFNRNRQSHTIFEIQRVICQKMPILTYPTCISHPCWEDSMEFHQDF